MGPSAYRSFGCVVLLASACGGGDPASGTASGGAGTGASSASGANVGGSGAAGGDPVQAWCAAVVEPFCDALFACCTDPQSLMTFGGSVEACKSEFLDTCVGNLTRDVGPLLAAGSSKLDTALLGACLGKLVALSAGGPACIEPPRWVLQSDCISAFQGKVPAGGDCITTPDDTSFVECDHGLCQGGKCEAFLEEGASCVPGAGFCDYTVGFWCAFDGTTGACAPRGGPGAPCTPVDASDPAIECKSLVCDASGTCAPSTADALCSGPG